MAASAVLRRLPIVKRKTYLANMSQSALKRETNDVSRTTNKEGGHSEQPTWNIRRGEDPTGCPESAT